MAKSPDNRPKSDQATRSTRSRADTDADASVTKPQRRVEADVYAPAAKPKTQAASAAADGKQRSRASRTDEPESSPVSAADTKQRTRRTGGMTESERIRRKKRIVRDALITTGVFLLAGAAVFFLVRFSMNVDAVTLYEPVYKFQVTEKITYRGMSRISFDDGVSTLKNGDSTLQLGTDPLYYEGSDSILLPADMILVMPDRPLLARAERFTVLSYTETGIELTRGTDSQMIARGFLYDGADRYVFLSGVRLTWPGQELQLSPLSCVTTTSDRQLLVIDHAADTATLYDTGSGAVYAQSESGYQVDLSTDKLTLADGTEALLFSRPEVLEPLF